MTHEKSVNIFMYENVQKKSSESRATLTFHSSACLKAFCSNKQTICTLKHIVLEQTEEETENYASLVSTSGF